MESLPRPIYSSYVKGLAKLVRKCAMKQWRILKHNVIEGKAPPVYAQMFVQCGHFLRFFKYDTSKHFPDQYVVIMFKGMQR